MSVLLDFLLENPVDDVTEKVIVSTRLKKHPFTVRAMSGDEYSDYQKASITIHKGKKVDFNEQLFSERVIINHCVEPNFKDADTIKKAGCMTPEQLLRKTMLAGEISGLSRRIMELSGFMQDMDELAEESKNS